MAILECRPKPQLRIKRPNPNAVVVLSRSSKLFCNKRLIDGEPKYACYLFYQSRNERVEN
jgi:hypothetical protein